MEEIVDDLNMTKALERVKANKEAPGVDKEPVEHLEGFLQTTEWSDIKERLLEGTYEPQMVRGVEIPKQSGGTRLLGIPTVVDRLIQQAMNQRLMPIFDPDFSNSSYGFRPGRSAVEAVEAARNFVAAGKKWVVDIDLEKFFDRINHDVLMARVTRKVEDKRVLVTIRRYLKAGIMLGGLASARTEGAPQGGALSPLLSNIMLDDLDKELEKRGHSFCRYADDCNIYVKSSRAGERVMASVTKFLEKKLKLKVNEKKSAVDHPWNRKFLGYSMTANMTPKLRIADATMEKITGDTRRILKQGRGWKLTNLTEKLKLKIQGLAAYFRKAQVMGQLRKFDDWVMRKIRDIKWRQWKRPRSRAKMMMRLGIEKERAWKSAYNGRGPWWNSKSPHLIQALSEKFFEEKGLISLRKRIKSFQCAT
jgi:group II intron reverse transcriptase/maturase